MSKYHLKTLDLKWEVGLFSNIPLDEVRGVGVYIIWHSRGTDNPETIYVGQGRVAFRLAEHRLDSRFIDFLQYDLCVAWAEVLPSDRGGVERYLAYVLEPKIGEKHPDATPINVKCLPCTYGGRIAERMLTVLYDPSS